jgi:TPR repeat protein
MKAAEQGHAEAQYRLAALYASDKKAAEWRIKAAGEGHVEAQHPRARSPRIRQDKMGR